jgi:hypothetical protein
VKFVATTRKEILEQLKAEGYTLIGVDGTVPQAKSLYDYLYDHHRYNGAEIQLDEMTQLEFQPEERSRDLCIITTKVDADAIAAAFRIKFAQRFRLNASNQLEYENDSDKYQFLRAVSYDCDHLCVPHELRKYADSASMVVAALKEESKAVIDKLGLDRNHQQWTIEAKEAYGSACFVRGVDCLSQLLNGKEDKWDYWTIAQPYWQKVKANTQQIVKEKRIIQYRDCLIFNQVGMVGYIDPRCWLQASQQQGITPQYPITLTRREAWSNGQFQGYSYTLGTIPFHPRQNAFDYTNGIFEALTKAERERNPKSDGWGGRATVGGSGWNTTSHLTPQEVIDIILS